MVNFSLETIYSEGTHIKNIFLILKERVIGSIKDLNIPIHNGK